ncbi:MAG: class II aldolase/adducin family protein [Bacteroidales bacterium]|nr:class II aldolase/adducin family protein [Bacteroidales bacterium]MDY0216160.1 class II aldolase/adducin family protein [Bacteroidales bacterium]
MSEEYCGVKFSVDFLTKSAPKSSSDLLQLIEWCRYFDIHQLAPPYPGGSAGNLSYRKTSGKPEFIITGTKIGLKNNLTEKQFVHVVDVDFSTSKIKVNGLIKPSSESMLHWAIYNRRPEINAIFHGHSPKILEKARENKWIITENEVPYGTPELVKEVLNIIENQHFIIIKNHGFLALGKNLEEAGIACKNAIF